MLYSHAYFIHSGFIQPGWCVAHRVGVVGASGYGGAELLRILDGHPAVEVAVAAAHGAAGEPVAARAPNLAPLGVTFDGVDVDALAGCDAVLLATPHGVSLDLAPRLLQAGTRVLDLSGGFRLSADDFATWYGQAHPRPDLTPAPYGLPELFRDRLAGADLVAVPGCYPTASLLALAPLAPLLEPGTVRIAAMSGVSGAGRSVSERLLAAEIHGDVAAYGAPTHRHTREIEDRLAAAGTDLGPCTFVPHLVPLARGLLATCTAAVREGVDEDDLRTALHDAYAREPFVTLVDGFPHAKALATSNAAHVGVTLDPRTGTAIASGAIDNLGKGAAGQAVQVLNLLLGLDERLGLATLGAWP